MIEQMNWTIVSVQQLFDLQMDQRTNQRWLKGWKSTACLMTQATRQHSWEGRLYFSTKSHRCRTQLVPHSEIRQMFPIGRSIFVIRKKLNRYDSVYESYEPWTFASATQRSMHSYRIYRK
jgi:hypothetical protein